MDERDRRIGRARLLRREGKTYDEIRAVVGPVSDDRLQAWLRGIPRPRSTWRSHPKRDLRRECRRLRAEGLTYSEIAAALGVAEGSISLWVRDVRRPAPERLERKRLAGLARSASVKRAVSDRRREVQAAYAATTIGPLTDRELFLVGIGLYWSEGAKSKPYQRRERVTFVNSDPTMVAVFLAWLRLVGVPMECCRFRVAIHETADVRAAEAFWAQVVGIDPALLCRTTLKRHRPETNRLNRGDNYRGCLVISLQQSASLYRFIAGWWTGLERQASAGRRSAVEWPDEQPWRTWHRFGR